MSKKTKKVYIIAEIGVNHNGQLSVAKKLIKSAKKCGADAVKFQTFRSESLVVPTAKKTTYQLKFDSNDSQLDMLKKYELSKSDHKVLLNYANNLKIDFISTPFDFESYKFLVSDLKLKTIKVSSTDITNIPYLLDLGSTNSKIIISTGMSTLRDVIIALSALAFGNKYKRKKLKYDFNSIKDKYFYKKNYKYLRSHIKLLHCTSQYPAPLNELNLNVLETYSKLFNIPIGYSDHSKNLTTPVIAVSKGATLIEVHITLDNNMKGPDHKASLEPEEFKKYIDNINNTIIMLGDNIKKITKSESKNIKSSRKSLVISSDLKKDDILTIDNLTIKRPGNGIQPINFYKYIGKKAKRALRINHVLKNSDLK